MKEEEALNIIHQVGRHHGEFFITDKEYATALRTLQKAWKKKNKKISKVA